MRAGYVLILSWAAGLAAYAAAVTVRGEVLSLDNWMAVGSVTLVGWLVASAPVTLPVLRLLATRGSAVSTPVGLAIVGALLASIPVSLTIGFWYGWHPRHLVAVEAGLLWLHYAVSGVILGLSLSHSMKVF